MKWAVRIFIVIGLLVASAGLMSFANWQGWTQSRYDHAGLASQLRPSLRYYVPEGEGPFPTVLQFHGCGSAVSSQDDWGLYFASQGYAAIVVDSLTPRGIARLEAISTVCTAVQLTSLERAGDILAALHLARELPFVDADQMFLAGWSHGGWSIMDLMAMDLSQTAPPNLFAAAPEDLDGVQGMILIYPYCGFPSQSRTEGWQNVVPGVVILGEGDTVAPAAHCLATLDRLSTDGIELEYLVYPNTGHDFDVSSPELFQRGTYLEAETLRAQQQVLTFLNQQTQR